MSINGINNTSGAGFQALSNPNALTAESLLYYCQTQLNDLDGQIKGYLDQQKVAIQKKEILNELKSTLSKYQPPKKENAPEIAAAYMNAYNRLSEIGAKDLAEAVQADALKLFPDLATGGDPSVGAKNSFEWNALLGKNQGWLGDMKLPKDFQPNLPAVPNKESWSGYVGNVSAKLDDITGDAELNMIQLQSLMGKRQTAIQLTTNIMAKHDQGLAEVVKNLR